MSSCQGLSVTTEAKSVRQTSPQLSRKRQLCQHLDFRLLSSRRVRESISVVFSHTTCDTLLGKHQETNCRRKWQPTPVFLPRESHGQRSLVGCCPQGRRVGHDLACMHWIRKWQPTLVFLPRGSQVQRSLGGCHLWGCTESDMTEVTQQQQETNVYVKEKKKRLGRCCCCC